MALYFGLSLWNMTACAGMLTQCASEVVVNGTTKSISTAGPVSLSDSGTSGGETWTASGTASASASPGANHNYAYAKADVSAGTLGLQSEASAQAYSDWSDYVTFTSSNPAVTSADVQVTFNLDATESTVGGNWGEEAGVWLPSAPQYTSLPVGWQVSQYYGNELVYSAQPQTTAGFSPSPSTALTIDTVVNLNLSLEIGVSLQTNAKAVVYDNGALGLPLDSSVTLDASNTALYGISIMTPGVSYTDNSGFAYPTNVINTPEPPSILLLGAGILALGVLKQIAFRAKPAAC